jgi:hypothetical protein
MMAAARKTGAPQQLALIFAKHERHARKVQDVAALERQIVFLAGLDVADGD